MSASAKHPQKEKSMSLKSLTGWYTAGMFIISILSLPVIAFASFLILPWATQNLGIGFNTSVHIQSQAIDIIERDAKRLSQYADYSWLDPFEEFENQVSKETIDELLTLRPHEIFKNCGDISTDEYCYPEWTGIGEGEFAEAARYIRGLLKIPIPASSKCVAMRGTWERWVCVDPATNRIIVSIHNL